MHNISNVLEELSMLKGYIPILINRVEFYFYSGVSNLRINPFFTHSENRIFINRNYINGLNEKEVKFLLLLNLMINHDYKENRYKRSINSIELIKYYSKLLSLDKELMKHLSIPEDYYYNLDSVEVINPFKNGHTKMEEEQELSLFLEYLPFLISNKDNINQSKIFEKLDVKHFENIRNDIQPYMKEYYNDILYNYWKMLNSRAFYYEFKNFIEGLVHIRIDNRNNIARRSNRRGVPRLGGAPPTYFFDEDKINIKYNEVDLNIIENIEIKLRDYINITKSENNYDGDVTIEILNVDTIESKTIIIQADTNSEYKFTNNQVKKLKFKFIDRIEDIVNYPNQNIFLKDDLSKYFYFDKRE